MRILVAGDDAPMRRVVIQSLQQIGHDDLVEAEGGVDATLAEFDSSINFIITHSNTPGTSGLALVPAVRAHPLGECVPILLVTTRSSGEEILMAVDAGVNNYIVHPFTPQVLKEKVELTLAVVAAARCK